MFHYYNSHNALCCIALQGDPVWGLGEERVSQGRLHYGDRAVVVGPSALASNFASNSATTSAAQDRVHDMVDVIMNVTGYV